ncbi:MAG: xylan 1,4-beta-xylosidase [Acidobacteriota bacterium]|nr:xylan 1,4-beta-xylosidase [Acidobacteriota bacterium]
MTRAVRTRIKTRRFDSLAALALCCVLVPSVALAQAVYHNPIIAGDHPDPTVLRVGTDYWALVTTGDWAPHFTIMRSRDLVGWQTVGAVFQQKPAWAKGDFWAPELIEDRGSFYLYYTARREDGAGKKGTLCVAVATAPQPSGPYTDHGPVVCQEIGSIDPFSLRDETGRRYLIWKEDGNDRNQPTPIWAQQLTEDGLRVVGKRRELLRNTEAWEGRVVEGAYVMRRDGWYYLFYSGGACCGRSCDYALGVARSRQLLGRWEKNPANPIIGANAAWQCPGHGDVVTTPDGREFLLYHSYRRSPDTFSVGRESVLDRLTWNEKGWPLVNGGTGPSTEATAPLAGGDASASVGDRAAERAAEFFDGFTTPLLDPAWQWPMDNAQSARIEPGPGGYLVLTPEGDAAKADERTGAVLGRRSTSGSYVATVALIPPVATDARAGLSAYGWRAAAVGISVGGGKVALWRREGRMQEILASASAPASALVFLRMTAERGETYRFEFSANGRDWQSLGQSVNGSYIEGAHVALTAGGPAGTPARFDWVRITPRAASKVVGASGN